jgi:NhaP-type Na+/H+ or K+/H+ antiporter
LGFSESQVAEKKGINMQLLTNKAPSTQSGFRIFRSLMVMLAVLVVFTGIGHAQLTEFEGQLRTANTTVWSFVQRFLQGGCFLYAVYLVYQAFFSQDKNAAWFRIIGLIAFIIVLQYLPALYATVTGASNPIGAGTP